MLILSRYANQSIEIGEEVRVTVISVKGDRVRLGIEAPKATEVDRTELRTRKRAELPKRSKVAGAA